MARIAANNPRERVSLERREEIDDGYGDTCGAWAAQFERDACILPSKGGPGAARPSSPRACRKCSRR